MHVNLLLTNNEQSVRNSILILDLNSLKNSSQAFDLGKSTKDTSVYNAMIRAYAYDGAADKAEVGCRSWIAIE